MSRPEPTYKLSTILRFIETEYGEKITGDVERAKQIIGRLNNLETEN